ncbi:virion core protein, T7 gp14 family [Reyranella sp.]|uniref:virion core protein, T7 gp14 family n=1 Tax=Reyranella sp. TaxID=1929291 RepID=UPI00403741C8
MAGAGLSTVGQMAKYQDNSALYIQNAEAANVALANTYNANQTRAIQEGDKAATESFDVVRGLAEAKGKSAAAAGEAGVEGVSFANILSDHEAKLGRARGNIDANYQMAAGQIQNDNEAARSRAKGQINSVAQPSETGLYAGVGADLFKAGLKIYDAFTPEKGKTKSGTVEGR